MARTLHIDNSSHFCNAVLEEVILVRSRLDLLLEALPALVENGGQLIVLGTGDARIEAALRDMAQQSGRVWPPQMTAAATSTAAATAGAARSTTGCASCACVWRR